MNAIFIKNPSHFDARELIVCLASLNRLSVLFQLESFFYKFGLDRFFLLLKCNAIFNIQHRYFFFFQKFVVIYTYLFIYLTLVL